MAKFLSHFCFTSSFVVGKRTGINEVIITTVKLNGNESNKEAKKRKLSEVISIDLMMSMQYVTSLGIYKKQTPWPLVRERTIPTERPPFVGEI
jgi:hypothetical protein